MKHWILIGTIIAGSWRCTSGRDEMAVEASAQSGDDASALAQTRPVLEDTNALVDVVGESANGEDLQRGLALAGPKPTILDADGLAVVFARIFAAGDAAVDARGNWFDPLERKALGTFDFLSRAADRRSLLPKSEVDLAYLRALRGFLGRGCGRLVDREVAALATSASQNTFVKALQLPDTDVVESFMRRVFGLSASNQRLVGVPEYRDSFAANLARASDADEAARNARIIVNFKFLCIAIGMDPRAYIR